VQIKWTDLASNDLDAIENYITSENSPSVALDVILRVVSVTELVLTNHPNAGRFGRLKSTRELVIDGVPFLVVYRQMERCIVSIRLLP
jgi:toxin ParE1/3/4